MEGIPAPPVWNTSWDYCVSEASRLSVVNVTASPGSFAGRTGHSGAVKLWVDFKEKIEGGTVQRRAAHDGLEGQLEVVDFCEWLDRSCPVESGRVELVSKRTKVPWYAEPGTYQYKYKITDKKKKTMLCVVVTLEHSCSDDSFVCAGLPLA
ncbi:hypothetical protein CYMTET_9436 [Cymbomonas tetramitiformis]|uniref:MD-2-related lipid-recognition domain-containing protein n=1 Tax=Cymbomonas tetramitiformis TaxID=36881 RepID=A0AAE0GRH7_9CHLO|nr:hypothetical protein CYMTET_9436 [Cymbomonas tetramitiformis]